jgi:dynein heavy chain
MTEIKFWEAKCMNLESLYEQMKAPTTKNMASILENTDSAYYPVFRSMFRNVVAALNEAQDITLYLKPLAQHFQNLEVSDFPDTVPQLRPLMHCVCIVYSNSTYYNSPARIIVLMQETCNLLVDAARKYLDPGSLFQVKHETLMICPFS